MTLTIGRTHQVVAIGTIGGLSLPTGGAVAANVAWQVFGVVDIGTTAHMEGVILSQTSITLNTGASAHGRLLAQAAITLAGNTVVQH